MIAAAFIAKLLDSRVHIFSTDPEFGVFGFMNSENWVFSYFVFGLISGVGYTACSVLSLFFFSPLVVSNAFLMEPFFA